MSCTVIMPQGADGKVRSAKAKEDASVSRRDGPGFQR
jgi:hypothetical protein